MWTNEFRSTQSFVLLSPYCSLVSCAIFGRMQPKTGTTTSSIMNTTKSRQGNKRGINKHLTLRIMGTTEHEEPRFFFILNKGAKSGGEITHAVLNGSIVSKPAGWDAFHGLLRPLCASYRLQHALVLDTPVLPQAAGLPLALYLFFSGGCTVPA